MAKDPERLARGQLEVIDAIYSAVGDASRWVEVTRAVTNLFGSVTSVLHRTGSQLQVQRMTMTDLDPVFVRSYQEHYGAVNPWAQWLASPRRRSVLHVNDGPLSADVVEKSEFYADWLRPLGDLRFTFDVCVELGQNETVELVGTRPRRYGPIAAGEQEVLLGLVPHLRRAIELSKRLEIAEIGRSTLDTAVQRLGTGMLLVDCDARVVFQDNEAELILANGGLTLRNGHLRAPPALSTQFNEAIARATGRGRIITGRCGSLLTVPRGLERRALSVAVGPVDERDQPARFTGPLALVLLSDPERGSGPGEDGLRALYNLTPVEARLVIALCAGETLASYAESTGTSLNTAKTHLKRVFDKTGEARQADLVRRLTSDLALRIGQEQGR